MWFHGSKKSPRFQPWETFEVCGNHDGKSWRTESWGENQQSHVARRGMGIQTASNSLGPEVRLMIFEVIRCYMFIARDYIGCFQMDLKHQFVETWLMVLNIALV